MFQELFIQKRSKFICVTSKLSQIALDAFVDRLKHVPGVVVIVVGGSQARGTVDFVFGH